MKILLSNNKFFFLFSFVSQFVKTNKVIELISSTSNINILFIHKACSFVSYDHGEAMMKMNN